MERRKFKRYETSIKVRIGATTKAVMGVSPTAVISDLSQSGAKIISPVGFQEGQGVRIQADMIGGQITVEGRVVQSRGDESAKVRFETTYAVHVKFNELLRDEDMKNLLALSR